MLNPAHPGQIVRDLCLEGLGLSVTEAAKGIGVSRPTLSKLLNGKAALSSEMAVRLAKAFGSTPDFWLKLQHQYELAQVERLVSKIKVRKFTSTRQRLVTSD
jgi:addiction module HigA family antidote